jgi:hypothetical protein
MPIKIYVRLLDEGTEVARPTDALPLGDGLFRVLPTPDYDPQDETWEFPPGSLVRCKKEQWPHGQGEGWLAVEP